ncbi:hypothetical protein JOC86_003990 [Bacillus pakistanensis]|uniref:Uncharacterized protein n=1 Tax=Rossellomorea pakistanensis TaxID=992288 RepID=A0ABS2NHR5_9BACI|nr:CBO0543 family protein [Bacillus pakistanensis]MBM7587417.1 hypothetical protein [Bacillus pakistanensis]
MSKEFLILVIVWLISIGILLKYIPKESKRTAYITFLFVQAIAWFYEYMQVLFKCVEYPYREFPIATKMSFSMHYLIYPTFGVFFIILYPLDKGKLREFIHTLLFAVAVSTYTLLIEHYSSLIEFKNWNWYLCLISNFIILYIIKKFVFWFKKGLA